MVMCQLLRQMVVRHCIGVLRVVPTKWECAMQAPMRRVSDRCDPWMSTCTGPPGPSHTWHPCPGHTLHPSSYSRQRHRAWQ
jgi:hypothetical protein